MKGTIASTNPREDLIGVVMHVTTLLSALCGSRIVSVGSGDGDIEREMGLDVVCVDPDPSVLDKVDYMYTGCVAHKRPDLVEHCVLMCVWPEPSSLQNGYDMQSIRLMKPEYVVMLINGGGSGSGSTVSGSNELMKFINSPEEHGYVQITEWMAQSLYSTTPAMMHAFAREGVEVPVIERGYFHYP